jgi:hypothetical protein
VQSRLFGYLSVCKFMVVDIVFEVWLLLYFINALRVFLLHKMMVINSNGGRWLEKLLYCCNSCDGIWYYAMLPYRDQILNLDLDRFIYLKYL